MYAGLKKAHNKIKCTCGGGLGVSFLGLAIVFLGFIVFLNIAEFSLLSYKKAIISKAVDYSVCSAVQQINPASSKAGIAEGFDEASGGKLTDNIQINLDWAAATFLNILDMNCKLDIASISRQLLICTTYIKDGKLYYIIRTNNGDSIEDSFGVVDNSLELEDKINTAITKSWPQEEDKRFAFINGNKKTNPIQNGTYLLAFIKGVEVKGLLIDRKIDFAGLAGAKISRLN